jgi:hypothetical protein
MQPLAANKVWRAAIQLAQNNPLTRLSRPRQPHSRAGCGGNPKLKKPQSGQSQGYVPLFDHQDTGLRRYDVFFC